jgi:lipoprotein-anchoring transpeptidase ErfK/SrfK
MPTPVPLPALRVLRTGPGGHRRRRIVPTVLTLAAVLVAGACGGTPGAGGPTTDHAAAAVVVDDTGTTVAGPAGMSLAARLTAPVTVRAEAAASAAAVTTLSTSTPLGSPTTVLVVDERDGWLQVSLPVRPNGSTGWIPRPAAELQSNPVAITVDRARHQLVLTRDGQVELEAPVADGTAANPTPAGSFYVTDLVETENAGGAYGPFALGLSGHSETLTEFAGGDGQLGLHGTNEPARIGQSVSHGCIRVTNDVITRLMEIVPLGTPVTVT